MQKKIFIVNTKTDVIKIVFVEYDYEMTWHSALAIMN